MRLTIPTVLALLSLAMPLWAQPAPPVLDVHLHALGAADQGPPPIPVCMPFERFPAWDQRTPYPQAFMQDPPCDDPIWSPRTDEELRDRTIEVMVEHNVYGVLSGPTGRVLQWRAEAPGRFLAGLGFRVGPRAPSPDSLTRLVETGALEVLAEVTNQYEGLPPDTPEMEPYWAMAERLDLPVGIHMGPGPPGGIYLAYPEYRASLSSALLLEEVLVRHPRLRVYIMHAGYPLVDDLKALLYAHPQVHVGLGVLSFTQPVEELYSFVGELVDAGFEDRIMFGSDQMNWPEAIARGIAVIEDAPFLSEQQKRAILYDNAARFLRLTPETLAAHRGG